MKQPFLEIKFPPVRQFTADIGRLSSEKHTIRALLEVDISDALDQIKQLRSPAHKISFLAWFLKVTADTVASHPPVNGIKKGRKALIVFKQVDIATIVEKTVAGDAVPLPLVIRAVNTKSPHQITQEIQNAVDESLIKGQTPLIGSSENKTLVALGLLMPQWLRLFVMRTFILRNPQRMQNTMGTVMVTSLGTVGQIASWIIPTSIHPLSIGVGTLTKKPLLIQGQVKTRQVLHLTITLDHDVIDGMPARAFVADLVDRLQSGYGLIEQYPLKD
jgi:pyruvate/2-oxoglutarate dehydrogenase complex dihydrolipoamide acyltransferase (E2) component